MKKSRKLIIANTFYQVIFSIQMKLTIFEDDCVEIIITDHSRYAEYISARLREYSKFDNVYFVNTNGTGDKRNNLEKIYDVFSFSFFKKNRFVFYIKQIKDLYFDEIIVFNYDMKIYGVFAILSYYNPKLKLSRYEEGILSYSIELLFTPVRNMIDHIRKLQGKAMIKDAFSNFYCFYPGLYNGYLHTKKVPLIKRDSALKSILQSVFDVNENNLHYTQKYIFFTSVYDFEGGEPIGEYELVCKIADLVGKKNLLVKTHPRDLRTVYTDNGFNVDENSAIPWEVIQLSRDFFDKVFMTVNSGSVLAGSFMSEKPVKTFYMYKLCNIKKNIACQKSVVDIKNLLDDKNMKDNLSEVYIADKIEDIIDE